MGGRNLVRNLLLGGFILVLAGVAVAGIVASGDMMNVSSGSPPFPKVGRYAIDDSGRLSLNVQIPDCPNTTFDVGAFVATSDYLARGLHRFHVTTSDFFLIASSDFVTDATGKFVGAFPGFFPMDAENGSPIPTVFAQDPTGSTCQIVNGF